MKTEANDKKKYSIVNSNLNASKFLLSGGSLPIVHSDKTFAYCYMGQGAKQPRGRRWREAWRKEHPNEGRKVEIPGFCSS